MSLNSSVGASMALQITAEARSSLVGCGTGGMSTKAAVNARTSLMPIADVLAFFKMTENPSTITDGLAPRRFLLSR